MVRKTRDKEEGGFQNPPCMHDPNDLRTSHKAFPTHHSAALGNKPLTYGLLGVFNVHSRKIDKGVDVHVDNFYG
jgi:hypothetical protein